MVVIAPILVVGDDSPSAKGGDVETILDVVIPKHSVAIGRNRPKAFSFIAKRMLLPLRRRERNRGEIRPQFVGTLSKLPSH
jgi:hypothetical protein